MNDKETTKFDNKFLKKVIAVILIIALVITAFVIYFNNRWKHELNVRYVGLNGSGELRYREYEITNTTNRTLKDTTMTFKVNHFGYGYDDFTFNETLAWGGRLQPGETTSVKLYWSTVKEEAERHETELFMADVEIKKITYK